MIQFNIDALIAQYGPSVVAAAQRQVEIAIWQDIWWTAALIIVAFAIGQGASWLWKNGPIKSDAAYSNDGFYLARIAAVGGRGAAVAVFFWAASVAGEAITFAYNPAYGTLQMIKHLVK